ncbi:hypothetical protein TMatcc_011270 [Talaromyces marneffei ATCC 18224]
MLYRLSRQATRAKWILASVDAPEYWSVRLEGLGTSFLVGFPLFCLSHDFSHAFFASRRILRFAAAPSMIQFLISPGTICRRAPIIAARLAARSAASLPGTPSWPGIQ